MHSLCERQISQTYISDKSGKVVSWEPKSCVSEQDSRAGLALTKWAGRSFASDQLFSAAGSVDTVFVTVLVPQNC